MSKSVSIADFIRAIQQLPSDPPVENTGTWYKTQKEHWLGWLSEYHGPGAYGRKTAQVRDARFAYNHIVEPKMLLWIIKAAGFDSTAIILTKTASMQQQSAAIRRSVPWETLERALWGQDVRE
jgi:hypothetical protein